MLDSDYNAFRKRLDGFPRSKTFTAAGVSLINRLRDEGRSPAEIAETLGCALGTLRVRCSQLGISLRQNRHGKRNVIQDIVRQKLDTSLTITLPPDAIERLRCRALSIGWTESQLASELLKVIAQDDLFNAILDEPPRA